MRCAQVRFRSSGVTAPLLVRLRTQVGFLFEDALYRKEKRELSALAAQYAEDRHCEALYLWLERRDDVNREQVRARGRVGAPRM